MMIRDLLIVACKRRIANIVFINQNADKAKIGQPG